MTPNALRTIICKAWNSPVEYPSRECKHDIKESKGNMVNPIFKENVQGLKHLGSCAFPEPLIFGWKTGSYLTEWQAHVDGQAQDCSNSIANALELLQSCTKPLMHHYSSLKLLLSFLTLLLSFLTPLLSFLTIAAEHSNELQLEPIFTRLGHGKLY